MASGTIYRWEFERRGESFALDVPGKLVLDDSDLMLRASREGAGLAYLSELQVEDDLAAGKLEQVLAEWTPPYPAYVSTTPEGAICRRSFASSST